LLRYLCLEGIDFVIRLSAGCYRLPVSVAPGPAYSKLSRQTLPRKRGVIKQFILNNCPLSIVMLKNPKNDPEEPILYFISSLTHKVKITEAYRRRWRIETAPDARLLQTSQDAGLQPHGRPRMRISILKMMAKLCCSLLL